MSKLVDVPEDIADKVHFYGIIETPNDMVKFYCDSYSISGNIISIKGMLLDSAVTRKAPFLVRDQIYYSELVIIGYMAVFTPYIPYRLRGIPPEGSLF